MTNMWRRLTPRNAMVAAGIDVLRTSARTFQRHRARRLSAGLAYYSLFAFIPTLFIATAIGAAFFGEEATEGRLADRLDGAVGAASAEQIEEAVAALWKNTEASAFAVVSVGLLVYSASALFVAWRDALNVIWDVPYQSGLETSIRSRAFGALVPISVGIVLASVLLVEMVLAWSYGIYVRIYGSSSAVGAASSAVLGIVLVYYSAQVLLYGTEVVRACADHRGRPIRPTFDKTGDR